MTKKKRPNYHRKLKTKTMTTTEMELLNKAYGHSKNEKRFDLWGEDSKNKIFDILEKLATPEPKREELLDIFPEAKNFLRSRKVELLKKSKALQEKIRESLLLLKLKKMSEGGRIMLETYISEWLESDLKEIMAEIQSIDYLFADFKRKEVEEENERNKRIDDRIIAWASQNTKGAIRICGLKVERNGMLKCPFHKDGRERTASMCSSRGFFYCFSCGESFDAIDLVRKLTGATFREAVEQLRNYC